MRELGRTVEQEVLRTGIRVVKRIIVGGEGLVVIASPGRIVAPRQMALVVVVIVVIGPTDLLRLVGRGSKPP